jgi:hypothetical protein
MSSKFSHFLDIHGIKCQLTTAAMPEQNGIAKGKNHTLIEAVRTMAAKNNLPAFLWEELFQTAAFL